MYEAAVYNFFDFEFKGNNVMQSLPKMYSFDIEAKLLLLELITGYINLSDRYLRKGNFSCNVAKKLAEAIADLHKLQGADIIKKAEQAGLRDNPPWIFSIIEPGMWYYLNCSISNIDHIRLIQNVDSFCIAVSNLKKEWKPSCLIHGDLKWDNCLIQAKYNSNDSSKIKIVDWEFARIGDPCWDTGTIFSDYLNCWLSSIPIAYADRPKEFLEFARFPLKKMHPAISSFWTNYVKCMNISENESAAMLKRSVSYAGIRLLQTGFELLQVQPTLTANAVFLCQLCFNILSRPLEAAVQLLGLPLPVEYNEDNQLSY